MAGERFAATQSGEFAGTRPDRSVLRVYANKRNYKPAILRYRIPSRNTLSDVEFYPR